MLPYCFSFYPLFVFHSIIRKITMSMKTTVNDISKGHERTHSKRNRIRRAGSSTGSVKAQTVSCNFKSVSFSISGNQESTARIKKIISKTERSVPSMFLNIKSSGKAIPPNKAYYTSPEKSGEVSKYPMSHSLSKVTERILLGLLLFCRLIRRQHDVIRRYHKCVVGDLLQVAVY